MESVERRLYNNVSLTSKTSEEIASESTENCSF